MSEAGLLLYNIEEKKKEKISKLCSELGIKVKVVNPLEYKQPIENLLNFNNDGVSVVSVLTATTPNDTFQGEMFIMVGFSNELLDKFLREYRVKQIEPVFLKAILTPYNKTWTSIMLYNELMREHIEMSRMKQGKNK